MKKMKVLSTLVLSLVLAASSMTAFAAPAQDTLEPTSNIENIDILSIPTATGIYEVGYEDTYCVNGVPQYHLTDVVKNPLNNKWYNIVNGTVVPGPALAKNASGWWYIDDTGVVDFTFTGFENNEYGTWYCQKGKVNFNANGVLKDYKTGKWGYVKGGKLQTDQQTVQKNSSGWWFIDTDGYVDFTANTLAKNENGWWAIKNGKVDFDLTGFADNYAGTWYCQKGKLNFNANGVLKDYRTGKWGYVKGGKLQIDQETVQKNASGWWYIGTDGYVDFTANTVAPNEYGWWYVSGGKVNFNYTGFASNDNGSWRIEKGKVNFNAYGMYYYSHFRYTVSGGKVTGRETTINGTLRTQGSSWEIDDSYFTSVMIDGTWLYLQGKMLHSAPDTDDDRYQTYFYGNISNELRYYIPTYCTFWSEGGTNPATKLTKDQFLQTIRNDGLGLYIEIINNEVVSMTVYS